MKDTIETPTLTSASFEELAREMLVRMGDDPDRDGLRRTPERYAKALQDLTKGYRESTRNRSSAAHYSKSIIDEMVIVKDIEMFSLCEHHVLPFFGKVHIAYIPKGARDRPQKSRGWWKSLRAACRCRSASPCRSPKPFRRSCSRSA